ncbi:integral membrane protein [Diaporthe amygdali]|uniref:uncharacterized protein n=1 Tax=Phomopsis amygdali TaxID=1214568 RepID=UPI0022FE6A4A|nr:uncharacterized protein J7T55_011556 [Diaporthe amygdali]KAJ0123092.1 integral membrane protein [Diaporthe amygdali]
MGVQFPLEKAGQLSVFAVALVFAVLSLVATALRLWSRHKLGRSLDASDYLMIASCVTTVGLSIIIELAIINAGLGFHVSEIIDRFGVQSGSEQFLIYLLAARITTTLSLALSKLSILALCCHCGPSTELWIVAGSLNILTDLIVLIIPMPYLFKLEMTMYKKVTLMVTFGLGLVVCIISAVKVALLPSVDTGDITFSIQHAMIMTVLESSLAVVLACIPVLRPLFRSAVSTLRTKSALGNYSTAARKSQKPRTGGFSVIEEQPLSSAPAPLPRRPELTYFSAEAVRASCSESKDGEDVEMGGITVKTEFIARYSHVSALS